MNKNKYKYKLYDKNKLIKLKYIFFHYYCYYNYIESNYFKKNFQAYLIFTFQVTQYLNFF